MVKFGASEYCKVLIILAVLTDLSVPYQIFSLEDDRICSPTTKPEINLGSNSLSGLIVSLTDESRLTDCAVGWENDFACKFQVNTSQTNNGLFVVIQNVVFRKDELTNECIDYVEFQRRNASASRRYCELMNADFASDVDAANLAPTINSFVEPSGVLDVHIYISRKPLRRYAKMDLEIVFTSFRHCFRNSSQEDQPCSAKYAAHCIYKNFFNDGYVNCPYPGCVDEGNCSKKLQNERKQPQGIKVAISVLMLLSVVSIVVGCCICRTRGKLCWSEGSHIQRNTYRPPPAVETTEHTPENQLVPNTNAIVISAAASSASEEDNNCLPPSYNSLFPNK